MHKMCVCACVCRVRVYVCTFLYVCVRAWHLRLSIIFTAVLLLFNMSVCERLEGKVGRETTFDMWAVFSVCECGRCLDLCDVVTTRFDIRKFGKAVLPKPAPPFL
jgi:hypothetical protein